MNVARSTLYAEQTAAGDDTAVVEAISRICDVFEHYGWRRVRAALRHQGMVVNHKKVRRLMREHGLQPKTRRRHTTTTDSDHDQPIFSNLSRDLKLDGPDQLWVADITYVPVIGGFVYVAIILDAWSRRVVGYAMSRSIDARLTLAALAVADRKPPPGCVHHSDRGSQYAAKAYRDELAARDLKGSMGRRGNPYDNAKAESFMKTLKVEAVYPMSFETSRMSPSTFPGSSTTSTTEPPRVCRRLICLSPTLRSAWPQAVRSKRPRPPLAGCCRWAEEVVGC